MRRSIAATSALSRSRPAWNSKIFAGSAPSSRRVRSLRSAISRPAAASAPCSRTRWPGDLRCLDGAVRDHLLGGTHQEGAPDHDAGADGDALDALHGMLRRGARVGVARDVRGRPGGAVPRKREM